MNTFKLHLQAADRYECLDDVVSFVGEDASGGFSLWACHARFMTNLVFGMARYRCHDHPESWEYLALPGGVLYFVDNNLYLATRRYFRHRDYEQIQAHLQSTLVAEEQSLAKIREQLQHMEQEMLRHVYRLNLRQGG